MNGKVNDGARTVHATIDDELTLCVLPWRGRAYIGHLTDAPVTCKLCIKAMAR